ncbi:MAG: GntR family transcriptional regulator [Burkholderiales bacterium]|jgi:GntR family transcriptional regulator
MPRQVRPSRNAPPHARPETPLYATLEKSLADAIRTGRHPEGSMLPTEAELSRTWSVSRQTVREALRRLDEQGLIVRRRGVGTRVARDGGGRRFVLGVGTMTDIAEYADRVRLKVESMASVKANAELATVLGCRAGSLWIEVRGWRYPVGESGTPVAVTRMWIRADYPGLERRLRDIGGTAVHRLLEDEFGEHIGEIEQEITAIAIQPDDARRLGVDPGSPGLRMRRRFHGRGGRVVLAGYAVYPGDRFSHTSHFKRDRA